MTPAVSTLPAGRRSGLGRALSDIVSGAASPSGARAPDDRPGSLLGGSDLVLLDAVPFPMLVADGGGRVVTVNRRWCEVSGLDRHRSRGAGWLSVFGAADRVALRAALADAAGGAERAGETRIGDLPARYYVASEPQAGGRVIAIAMAPVGNTLRPSGGSLPPAVTELLAVLDDIEGFLDRIEGSALLP